MAKIVSKGRKTWKDGTMMTYTISDEGVLTLSGVLKAGNIVDIKSKAPFHHVVIEEGVTFIGGSKYHGFFYQMNDMEELTLPASLTTIGPNVFYECKSLKRINFAEGLKHIAYRAFWDCESLKEVRLPQSLTTIDAFAFCGCNELKKVQIPKGVKRIGEKAFWCCAKLKDVQMAKGVERIDSYAFARCKSLESVKIPKSVTYIGDNAFDECPSLKDVVLSNDGIRLGECAFGKDVYHTIEEGGNTFELSLSHIKTNRVKVSINSGSCVEGDVVIPERVEYNGNLYTVSVIEENAFAGSSKLTSVTLPDSIEEINDYAFSGCPKLKKVMFGKSVRRIGLQSFSDCPELEIVDLGPSLECVGYDAFNGCRSLKSISLPETVNRVECYAFEGTKVFEGNKNVLYLDHVLCGYGGYFPEHSYLEVRNGTTVVAERAFTDTDRLEGVIFNEGLKHIGYCAFDECKDLKYIKLPKSLVSMGDQAFGYTSIEEVVVPWKKPIEIDYMPFPESTVIYIPKGATEAYSQAKYWNEYKLVER